jgi:P4 family phage/plasmid primase-like protien
MSSEANVVDISTDETAPEIEPFQRGDQVEVGQRLIQYISNKYKSAPACSYDVLYICDRSLMLWKPLTREELINIIGSFAGAPVFKCMKDGEPQYSSLRIQSFDNAIKFALAFPKQTYKEDGEFFDKAPVGVAFRKHFVTMDEQTRKLKVERLAPEHRCCWTLDADYKPGRIDDLEESAWGQYLRTAFANDPYAASKIAVLQEFLGACLFGMAGSFQRALMLVGEGSNGKSVFMQVVEAMFPDNARSNVAPQDLGDEYARAALMNSRVNIVQEVPENEMLATDKIKALITCERMAARFPYGRVFSFTPKCGQLYSANKLPGARDRSRGFWRRWIVLEFGNEFVSAQDLAKRPGAQLLDRGLTARILKELDLVAVWALEGAARLLAQGEYTDCEASEQAMLTWRSDTDQLYAFAADCVEIDALDPRGYQGHAWTSPDDLYRAYMTWCAPGADLKRVRDPLALLPFLREIKGVITRSQITVGSKRNQARYRCRVIGSEGLPPGL